jgi:hypothetical protein
MASSRPALTEAPQRNQPHWSRPVNSGPRPCLFDVGFPLSGLQDRTSTSVLSIRARHTGNYVPVTAPSERYARTTISYLYLTRAYDTATPSPSPSLSITEGWVASR